MTMIVAGMVQLHIYRLRRDAAPEFLLLQRAGHLRIYPGIWQPVTGHIESGESADAAALRELEEETGLHPEEFGTVPHVASFYSREEDAVHLIPVFWCRVAAEAPVRLSDEHQRCAWLGLPEAASRLPIPSHRAGLELLSSVVLPHPDLFRAPLPARRSSAGG
jgi:8-oxo-dGTP pyrophosphatase MutT (NUDIX family)